MVNSEENYKFDLGVKGLNGTYTDQQETFRSRNEKTLKNDAIYLKNTKVTHHQIVSDNLSIYNLFHIFICSVKHLLSDLR